MTPKRAKELLPVIAAFAEGKTVQYLNLAEKWKDVEDTNWADYVEYRIKPPEPKLRPWRPEEVPLGAWYRCNSGLPSLIIDVLLYSFQIGNGINIKFSDCNARTEYSIDHGKTWQPCGVIE